MNGVNLQDLIKTANQKEASEEKAFQETMVQGAKALVGAIKTAKAQLATANYGYGVNPLLKQAGVNNYNYGYNFGQNALMEKIAAEQRIAEIVNAGAQYGLDSETSIKLAAEAEFFADMVNANLMKLAEDAAMTAPAVAPAAPAAPAAGVQPNANAIAEAAGAELAAALSDPNLLNDPQAVELVKQMLSQLSPEEIAELAQAFPVVQAILQQMNAGANA